MQVGRQMGIMCVESPGLAAWVPHLTGDTGRAAMAMWRGPRHIGNRTKGALAVGRAGPPVRLISGAG